MWFSLARFVAGIGIPFSAKRNLDSDLPASLTGIAPVHYKTVRRSVVFLFLSPCLTALHLAFLRSDAMCTAVWEWAAINFDVCC